MVDCKDINVTRTVRKTIWGKGGFLVVATANSSSRLLLSLKPVAVCSLSIYALYYKQELFISYLNALEISLAEEYRGFSVSGIIKGQGSQFSS